MTRTNPSAEELAVIAVDVLDVVWRRSRKVSEAMASLVNGVALAAARGFYDLGVKHGRANAEEEDR